MGGKSSGSGDPPGPEKKGTGRPEVSGMNRQAFDAWLDRQLREMYEAVTAEPVPDDLLAMLNKPTQKK